MLSDYSSEQVAARVWAIQRLVEHLCNMPVRPDRMGELESQNDALIGKIDLLTDDLLIV
jgi:hypothetical protein